MRSFWHGLALVPWALGDMIDSGPSMGYDMALERWR
jgi:hypothetical protein